MPSKIEQTLPVIISTPVMAHSETWSTIPIFRTQVSPTGKGQIGSTLPQMYATALSQLSHPLPQPPPPLVPPQQPPQHPSRLIPPAVNCCQHLHSSQSGGYGPGKQDPGVQLISMEMYAAHKQTGARLIRAAPLIHCQPPACTSPGLFLGSFTKQMYLIKKETPEQPERDESCIAVSKGAALSPGM